MEKILSRIAELKEELREMVDNCEVQTRSLNDAEVALFNEKEQEIISLTEELAQRQAETIVEINTNTNNQIQLNKMNFKETLASAMRAVANNRSTEEFGNVAGNVISLREDTVSTDAAAAAGIIGEYPTELIEPLQAALLVDKLGIKVINTPKAVVMPSVSNVEATIEGETTSLVGKKLSFTKTKVAPFRVGLSLPFSNTAIKEADINLVSYAINLAAKAEAQLINKVMFAGAAVNGQNGAFVKATAISGEVTYKNIVALAGKVKQANVIIDETAAYVISPEMEATLMATPVDNGSGRMILENGMIAGYPVLVSSAVEGYIGFGVFSNFLIQKVGVADMVVDNLSRSKENITEVNFNDNLALQVIRQEAFAKLTIA